MKYIDKFIKPVAKNIASLIVAAFVCAIAFTGCSKTDADNFPNKSVENVELETEELILRLDETIKLYARLTPIDATNRKVVWSIAEGGESFATVDQEGRVTGVAEGETKVFATSDETSEIFASCVVKVQNITVPVSSVAVKPNKVTVEVGKTHEFAGSATILPENADMKGVKWSIKGTTSLATITPEGKFTAIEEGVVTVVAIADQNSKRFGECEVTITPAKPKVESIVIAEVEDAEVVLGATTTFTATVSPAESNQEIVWSLKDAAPADCATIDEATGELTAAKVGEVTIVATSAEFSDMSGEYTVNIVDVKVPATAVVIPEALTLEINTTYEFEPVFTPADANVNTDLVWTTSDSAIATVSAEGVVSVQGTTGTVTITATSQTNSAITASCEIKVVTEIIEMPDFSKNPIQYLNTLADQCKSNSKADALTLKELAPEIFADATTVTVKAMLSNASTGNHFTKMLSVSDMGTNKPNSGLLLIFTTCAKANAVMHLTGVKVYSELEVTLNANSKLVNYGNCKMLTLANISDVALTGNVADYVIPEVKAADLESYQNMVVSMKGITATNEKQSNTGAKSAMADGTQMANNAGATQTYVVCTDSADASFPMFFKGAISKFKIPYKAATGDLTGLVQYFVAPSSGADNLLVVGPRTPDDCAAFHE